MIELAIAAAAVGVVALTGVGFNLKARRVWKKFAEEQGLSLESARGAVPRMRGQRRGFDIELRGFGQNEGWIEIRNVDPWFSLNSKPLMRSEVPVGDPSFDAQVAVHGDPDFALALLHDEVRSLIQRIASENSVRLVDGSLHSVVHNCRQEPERIDRLLDLAEKLRRPSSNDLPPLLARNALNDTAPGFRLLAFRQLATEFPKAPEVLQTAVRLLLEDLPELRLQSAKTLLSHGEELRADLRARAAPVLEAIVESSDLGLPLREQALDAIVRYGDPEIGVRLATAILTATHTATPAGDEPAEMRRAAIEALVLAEASEELMAVTPARDPNELKVLARGLGKIGDVRAQRRLLAMLERPYEDLQIAAAEALGAVGNARAVPALRQAALSHPDPRSFEGRALEEAVEDAVAKIQHRLGGSQGGEVSLTAVEPLQGAVSPADDDAGGNPDVPDGGEVSLTD